MLVPIPKIRSRDCLLTLATHCAALLLAGFDFSPLDGCEQQLMRIMIRFRMSGDSSAPNQSTAQARRLYRLQHGSIREK